MNYNSKHSYIYIEKVIKNLWIKNEVKNKMNVIGKLINIKAKTIYENSIKKQEKRKSDVVAEEEDNNSMPKDTVPSFNRIKPSTYRLINKNIPKDIEVLSDLPNESSYYFTERGIQNWKNSPFIR